MQNVAVLESDSIIYIPIELIKPSPYHPRVSFDMIRLKELSRSIRQYGVINPIVVRLINNSFYEVVSGERRLKATKLAGLKSIPAFVVNVSDRDSATLSIVENMHKESLSEFEEAKALRAYLRDFKYSVQELSHIVGKSYEEIKEKLEMVPVKEENKNETCLRKHTPNIKKCFKDVRLFFNTIKQAVEIMNKSGVDTRYEINKFEDYYEIKVKISAKE